MFCYNTDEIAGSFKSSPNQEYDANQMYAKHFANMLYLEFIEKNSDDWQELKQVRREKEICQRKLDYWKKKPDWSSSISGNLCNELKRKWR